MNAKSTLTVDVDKVAEFKASIANFKRDAVLIGIPTADNERSSEEAEAPFGNAAILAVNEFGSEEAHIPARPVMKLGIRAAQDQIALEFKKAVQQALGKGMSALEAYYERAGIIASNSVKKQINSQEGIEAPSPATIAARLAAGFKGTKALIVTGQVRNAITYVLNLGGF